MARLNLLVALAVIALLAGSARADLRKLLQTCTVTVRATSTSTSSAAFSSAFTSAFDADLFKTFCSSGGTVPSSSVVASAIADAGTALATASATAQTRIQATATISASCSPASWASISASSTARSQARAIASSYSYALAQVIGQAAYAGVQARIEAEAFALQESCNTALLSITTNGKLTCQKSCSSCNTCSTCSTCRACTAYNCVFAQQASMTLLATASARAIAEAIAIVTTTPGTGVCTYDGTTQTCAQFTQLCDAVCNPADQGCGIYPTVTTECETGWAMFSNGVYACPPPCQDGQTVTESIVDASYNWVCVDPPSLPPAPMCNAAHTACDPANCPIDQYPFTCLSGNGPTFDIFPSATTQQFAKRGWVAVPIPGTERLGVAFNFVAEYDGTLTAETTQDGDPYLYLFDAVTGNMITSNDDGGPGLASLIVQVVGGSSYTIYLSNFDLNQAPTAGLSVTLTPLP